MYVCICNSVTESDIEQAVNEGCNSLHHIEQKTGASSQCGSCSCDVSACLQRSLEKQMDEGVLANF